MRELTLELRRQLDLSLRRLEPLALIALLVVPLYCTLYWNSFRVNLIGGMLLVFVAAIRPPQIGRHWFEQPRRARVGVGVIAVGLVFVSWQLHHGDLWLNSQFLLYFGVALAFPAFVSWFGERGTNGLTTIFSIKLGTILGASLLVLAASLIATGDIGSGRLSVRDDAVIYRHLRHFNYDQLALVAICAWWAATAESRIKQWAAVGLLVLTGYLLGVVGGRGALVAMALFFGVLTICSIGPRRRTLASVAALLTGIGVAIVLGQAENLLGQIDRTLSGTNITANRLELWSGSLSVWTESWRSILFGFGPDALRTYVRGELGYVPNVQAHNAFVQVLIEFGLAGLIAFVGLLAVVAGRVASTLRSAAASVEAKVCAAALVAFGAYMLVDGIVYHALPLIFVTLLTAFLFSSAASDSGRKTPL